MLTIGQRIKELREKKGMSLAALAEATGLKKSGLSAYENDKYEPSAKATISLSEALGISTDFLLTGKNPPTIERKEEKSTPNASIVLTDQELDMIMKFRKLDYRDREDAKENIDMKYDRMIKRGMSSGSTSGGTGEEAATNEAV